MFNKKLLVMMMVPVLVVMSGSLAFSAFTGTINTSVNTTAGTFSFSDSLLVYGTNAQNTQLTITGTPQSPPPPLNGPNGGTGDPPHHGVVIIGYGSNTQLPQTRPLITGASDGTETITQTITITNLAPGDVVEFEITVTNTGTVGMIAGSPAAPTLAGYQNTNVTFLDPSDANLNFATSNLGTINGWTYGASSYPSPGTVIEPQSSYTYYLFFGLGSLAGDGYMGQTVSFTFVTIETSAP